MSHLEFSVEYLSPLVVRKEIENIILNKSKDEETLIDAQFMLKHTVIFWNLTWYFKRIGVDGSYLLDNLLNSRLEQARQVLADHGYQLNDTPPTFLTGFQTKASQPFGQHSRVKLTLLWDNVKLKNEVDKYEIPLYLSWLNAGNLENRPKGQKNSQIDVLKIAIQTKQRYLKNKHCEYNKRARTKTCDSFG